jgi:hypothetical protein
VCVSAQRVEGKIHRVDPDFGSTLTAANRDSRSNCWINWKIMGSTLWISGFGRPTERKGLDVSADRPVQRPADRPVHVVDALHVRQPDVERRELELRVRPVRVRVRRLAAATAAALTALRLGGGGGEARACTPLPGLPCGRMMRRGRGANGSGAPQRRSARQASAITPLR